MALTDGHREPGRAIETVLRNGRQTGGSWVIEPIIPVDGGQTLNGPMSTI